MIDLTRVLGGPYCTQILGDHGAEVIKVEPPQGDEVRDWGPPFDQAATRRISGVNRNKRALGLDLGRPEGRDVLLRLLEHADILIEKFKPGAMEKWGLGYDAVLREHFPRLIHCRISGFGADGPMGSLPGYDAVIQAMSGMFSINGMPQAAEGGGQTRIGIPLVDIGTGLYAAIGLLMALVERARSGLGQFIDMTLYDAGIALMHPHIANYVLSGKVPGLTGNAHPNISPYDKFPTRTVDVFLAIGNDRAFGRVLHRAGRAGAGRRSALADQWPIASPTAPALTERLQALLKDQDGEALCARLLAAGVPAGPVRDMAQVWSDAHTHHRGMAAEVGDYRGWGLPIKFSRTPGEIRRTPPRYGAHGRKFSPSSASARDEIDRLADAGVLVEQRRR